MRVIASRNRLCCPLPGNGTTSYLGALLPAAIAAASTTSLMPVNTITGRRLILRDPIREASLRAQALGLALRDSFRPEVWLIWYKFSPVGC